jgi:hypothetical protein
MIVSGVSLDDPLLQSALHKEGNAKGLKRLPLFYYNTQTSKLSTKILAVVFAQIS